MGVLTVMSLVRVRAARASAVDVRRAIAMVRSEEWGRVVRYALGV